ncbi:MAG TPA: ABC transporter ATP-binding protein [Candidatus Acidoferrales bacterium]|nr:ABC transporter ATP-binding protein [Candidatus Acidoferrales bacterium]
MSAHPLWSPAPVPAEVAGAPLAAVHVARWYGNVVAVNDVTFGVGPGVTGLLGPNGAGKSTLLHMLAGLLAPSSGLVLVEGRAAWRNPQVYRRLGLSPERDASYGFLTGREFALLSARLARLPDPDAAARRAIALVDMEAAADRPIGGYSKGMRQRVKLASALVHDPQILLLDEPFNGMDPRQRLHMMALLQRMAQDGRVILFSSHILEEVERLAERVLVMVAGRLAAAGDYRAIRRLMTDRPHTFTLRTSDDRAMAARLVAEEPVLAVQLVDGGLDVRAADYGSFTRLVARVAAGASVSLYELRPTDETLESVFSYLVSR